MKWMRRLAAVILIVISAACLLAGLLAAHPYELQFRDRVSASPSAQFPMGTDELGRDRLSRLLYGMRLSLSLAPVAALASTAIAAILGIVAGHVGGWFERGIMALTDLFLSLPWLFLILTVRAVLPLNVSPAISVTITFALLGLLGWASAARVIRTRVRSLEGSDFVLQARALGCSNARLMFAHILPNLKPVLFAQFWIAIPLYLLSEADLGLLGLGVVEPLPSLGNLLRELINFSAVSENLWILTPAMLVLVVVSCFHLLLPEQKGYS